MRYLLLACVASGCIDTSLDRPFRADIVAFDGVDPSHGGGRYSLRTVDLPDLESFAPLGDATFDFLDRPRIEAKLIGTVAIGAALSDADTYSARVEDVHGIAVPRDYRSLSALSSYSALRAIYDRAPALTGRSAAELTPGGGFPVMLEPELYDDGVTQTLSVNAFYSSDGPFFGIVRVEDVERLPIATSHAVLSHEFGHHLFFESFGKADGTCDEGQAVQNASDPKFPGRLGLSVATAGLNEGYADFVAFAALGVTNVLYDSLPDFAADRALDPGRVPWVDFEYTDLFTEAGKEKCGNFYCIGTLFARSLLAAFRADGGVDGDAAARAAFATEVFAAWSMAPIIARADGLPVVGGDEAACTYDSELVSPPLLLPHLLGGFVKGLAVTRRPSVCRELFARFGESGFPVSARGGCP
jgi:hypothetical protein